MGILKRWYQSAIRHTNLYKFCKRNQPVSYSFLKTLHYKSTQDIDLTSCDFGGTRNIHTESQSEMEAWEAMVDYSKLSETDLKIHQRHVAANKARKLFYVDPQTGYQVMTRRAHLERGECCGNECRHCPYGRKNVSEEKRRKKFNSAFYI